MLTRLTDKAQLLVAKKAFDAVFRSSDPFNEPFQPTVESRLLLYPAEYQLYKEQFAAIRIAAKVIGESSAYLSLIEGYHGEPFAAGNHWQIDLDPNPYEALRGQEGWFPFMENAIYSISGAWGIIISHEQHAVVGGTARFIETLKANSPDLEKQIYEFLALWKDNRDRLGSRIAWLPHLLTHVYGQETAQKIMLESGLSNEVQAE